MGKKKYKQHRLTVQSVHGPQSRILGWSDDDTPEGLYAVNTEKVLPEVAAPTKNPWTIVHHEGYTLAVGFTDRSEALEAASWFVSLADFTLPAVELPLIEIRRGVIEALAEFGRGGVA